MPDSLRRNATPGDRRGAPSVAVIGLAGVTVSQGKIVWMDGELRTQRGAGRYVKRPAFAPMFDALKRKAERHVPQAVARAG